MATYKPEESLVINGNSHISDLVKAALAPLQLALRNHSRLTIFLCGNPARGDDGAGFVLHKTLNNEHKALIKNNKIKLIYDLQWQVEDVCELENKGLFLFIDASARLGPPVFLSAISSPQTLSSTSHSLSPSQLLSVANQVGIAPPEVLWQLGITGHNFELGDEMSTKVQESCSALTQAINELIRDWCAH